jgi:hypothetical protein
MEVTRMNANHTFTRNDLAYAMINYDNAKRHRFTLIDLTVMEAILSDAYTTDMALANIAMCSLSTIKRSINKLCDFGFLKKHIAYDNTKTLDMDHEMLKLFIDAYFYAEPYYSEYKKTVGVS